MASSLSPASRKWTEGSQPRPGALSRLLALPYAGGSSAIYRGWQNLLPHSIEPLAVQLPGRGSRRRERLADSMAELAFWLADGLAPLFDKPYSIFGHSMGALLAFELCRELRRRPVNQPQMLFVAGCPGPPTRAAIRSEVHLLPDHHFAEVLRRFHGTPPEVLENAELMRLALPMLRSDFKICETYRYVEEAPLDVPIVVLAGTRDHLASPAHSLEWQRETLRPVICHDVEGSHFFLRENVARVVEIVASHLGHPGNG